MMKKLRIAVCSLMVLMGLSQTAFATSTSNLYDYGFNVDGNLYWNDSSGGFSPLLPSGLNTSGFNFATGLGTVTATINGPGSHSFLALFDHDINGDFDLLNETGSTTGSAATGQSWQIGDPSSGIYDNFKNNSLSNTNGIATNGDVAMAMGWNFTLGAGQYATLTFGVYDKDPWSFELIQFDPNLNEELHFGGDVVINGGGVPTVPEPSTFALFGSAVAGLVLYVRNRNRNCKNPIL